MSLKITDIGLGAKIIEPTYYNDNRGYSVETMNLRDLNNAGIKENWILDYQCLNIKKGTIRGIHFQNNPLPQAKLVRVLTGKILDFVIDLRKDSPTFKQWVSQEISAENHKEIYIPSGCGHAFITLEDNTIVLYKFDNYYSREFTRAIKWNDSEINIKWPDIEKTLSNSDLKAPSLKESDVNL